MSTFDDLVNKLKDIYVSHKDNIVTVKPEYVYITIPADYICLYHKLLMLLSNYGIDELKECCASCKDVNGSAINLFNMFNAAVAARNLKQDKLAETIIKYITSKLNHLQKHIGTIPTIVYPVDEQGMLLAAITCKENPEFEIDIETGCLFQKAISEDTNGIYEIKDNNLIIEK